jgi:thiol:disulfide interchange protein
VRHIALFIVAVSISLLAVGAADAQVSHYTDGLVGQFDSGGLLLDSATVSAKFTPPSSDRPAILMITAKIAKGKHTYSLTQPPGGPQPTTIELQPSPSYRQLGAFRSQPAPKAREEDLGGGASVKVEEHEGQVTWYSPIEFTAGTDPKTVEIRGTIHMQVCETHGVCEPVNKEFVAKQASADAANNLPTGSIATQSPSQKESGRGAQSETGKFQAKDSAVKLEGRINSSTVRPGESAELLITAIPPANGHLYALAARDNKIGTKPFLIAVESASGLVTHAATTDAPTKTENSPVFGALIYHDAPVTWKLLIDVPKNATPGEYPISGMLGYQACEFNGPGNSTCELPRAVNFAGTLKVGDQASQNSAALTFSPGESYRKAAQAAAAFADRLDQEAKNPPAPAAKPEPAATRPEAKESVLRATDHYELSRITLDSSSRGSLSYYLAIAFVGGLILNLMPCVLPVIGLKVMSFVEQTGKSRTHALVLNLWFAAGIVSVFVLLGVLAVVFKLSWGAQFGSTAFNVVVAAVVFAMALSLLGVWEVPIPGFFGSGSVNSAAAKEGPLGAYLKGVVTTVLATPCTAPFMASAVAWAVAQTVPTTLAVFATLGIGMASPYVLVGVFPELLRFLPKPGPWMETFKQVSGFVLLGTVVFILSFIDALAVVPTLALLLGIAVACWRVARTPLTAEYGERMKAWAYAGAIVAVFGLISFGGLYRMATSSSDTAWQPFSLEKLKQVAVDEGRTVLVDFSAEWCLNCKFFERTVLHTKPVEQAIAGSGAVTMYGDFTKYPPEIEQTIKALGANGVPVIAIFPGDAPYEPIVFRGGYTSEKLIAALDRAKSRGVKTASRPSPESTASAAPRN